jgi:ArsR family transcriptional regulator
MSCGTARNVGKLAEAFEMSQPSVSRRLKVLRDRRMVRADRSGMNIYNSLADRSVIQALDLLREVLAQTIEDHQSLIHEVR